MVNSNVSSNVQEREVKVDNNNTPASNREKAEMASSNVPSATDKQEIKMDTNSKSAIDSEKDNAASNNFHLTEEKQEIKMENSSIPALDKEKIIGTATSEMEYRVELFNRLTHTCFHKCVDKRYKDGELNIGENSCIDRCVSKYSQVNNIIGHVLAYGRRDV